MQRVARVHVLLVVVAALAIAGCGGESASGTDADVEPDAGLQVDAGPNGNGNGDADVAECTEPSQCPGVDTTCQQRTCEGESCGVTFATEGTECVEDEGNVCDGDGGCVECLSDGQCDGEDLCDTEANVCVPPACQNGELDPGETDIDCGGPDCAACEVGKACEVFSDCESGLCVDDGDDKVCASCTGDEQCQEGSFCDLDTGFCEVRLVDGGACERAEQCESGSCADGVCCDSACDGVCESCNLTGVEGTCTLHAEGTDPDNECGDDVCSGLVAACRCDDGEQNGDETDVDCGGGVCGGCDVGESCEVGDDCATGACAEDLQCALPEVAAVEPGDGAIDVPVDASIEVEFTGVMNPATLVAKTTLDSGACTGTLQVSTDDFQTCISFADAEPTMSAGDRVATWVPAPGLAFGSSYQIKVTTDAESASGAPLADEFVTAAGFQTELAPICETSVVISQVYPGGGNTGAPFDQKFVELHNRSAAEVSLDGWALQYAAATSGSWGKFDLTGTIEPGGYFLIGLSSGSNGEPLPTPDLVGTLNPAMAGGKIALTSSDDVLSGNCPLDGGGDPSIVDFIGYGGADCFEGSAAAPSASNSGNALKRDADACIDTDDNGADFAREPVDEEPLPRNSSSPAVICCVGLMNETGDPLEADFCNVQHPSELAVELGQESDPVFGQIFEAGVTEGVDGPLPQIRAELGFGPRDRNPQWQPGWTFVPAAFNTTAGNNHEYSATLTPDAPGDYGYLYRFSLDGGASWTLCDLNGAGSNAGLSFETPHTPLMSVPSPE